MDRRHVANRRALVPIVAAIALLPGRVDAQSPLTRVSVDANGQQGNGDSSQDSAPGSMSADGRWVAFASVATNLVPNDKNGASDVFVRDQTTGAIVRVSVNNSGVAGNGSSFQPALSRDGRFVAFQSYSSNFAHDTNFLSDVYLHDRDPDGNGIYDEGNGRTSRVSVASGGGDPDHECVGASISSDGSRVAFTSLATNLVAGDTNGLIDVFVRDLKNQTTVRVSVDSSGAEGNASSFPAQITADGHAVVFASQATNLVTGDTNGWPDVFLHDLSTATTSLVSTDASGNQGDYESRQPSISDDGRFVAFTSSATNLVAGDTNRFEDIFVKDLATGTVTRVSVDSAGVESFGNSYWPAISGDGQVVVFTSAAVNLVPGDTNGIEDVFVHELAGATTISVSSPCGIPGNSYSESAFVSGNGRFAGFRSFSDDLVPGDTNVRFDVFVHDRSITADAAWSNYGAGFPGTNGVPSLAASALPKLGTSLSIDVTNSLGAWSVGQFFVGTATASIPTRAGGTLLVGNLLAFVPFVLLPATPTSFPIALPFDPALCGFHLYVQALELDAGAAHGLSFTPGLELDFGG
jgi:Tol biopolymer transport system component